MCTQNSRNRRSFFLFLQPHPDGILADIDKKELERLCVVFSLVLSNHPVYVLCSHMCSPTILFMCCLLTCGLQPSCLCVVFSHVLSNHPVYVLCSHMCSPTILFMCCVLTCALQPSCARNVFLLHNHRHQN